MKLGQKFNKLTIKEYRFYIENHKKYTDFNTLGLYRSIVENDKLTLAEKIEVRDYAHAQFRKSFDFLQLKDPRTYFEVLTLGQELTDGDIAQLWKEIRQNQQKILSDKRIRHRNFGEYSKHNCGYDTCVYNGLMVREGSWLKETSIHFNSDKNAYNAKVKAEKRKADRKNKKQQINRRLDVESE
jgi:hypothetical protein